MVREYEKEAEKCRKIVIDSYKEDSIIEDATRIRHSENDAKLNFVDIYVRHLVPRSWFINPAIFPDIFFSDLGRNIAIGEENYFIKKVNKHSKTVATREIPDIYTIKDIVSDFMSEGYTEPVLFIPIEHFVPFHLWFDPDTERPAFEFEERREFLKIDLRRRVRVFWSSKLVEFDKIMLLDKNFGTWIVKPGNVSKRLTIKMKPEEEEKVDVLIYTRVTYKLENRNAILKLRIPAQNK